MKRYVLNTPTFIALLLIPVVAILRAVLPSISLNGEVTSNSVLLLMLGIYCFVVCTINLVRLSRLWKNNDSGWKRSMGLTYLYVVLFAIGLAFVMMFAESFEPLWGVFLFGLMFGSLPFLCPIGIVLFILGLSGLRYAKNNPKSYLVITFLVSVLFTLGGAFPSMWVFIWWAGGGIQMCYCPVNKRSFRKDVLLKPLYIHRRRQLAKKLQIQL